MIYKDKSGFTVIELLVTLFIAAAFLATGYQLYGAIIKDAGQTRAEARANNVAYDYIKRYESSTTSPCTNQTPLNNAAVSISGMTASTVSIDITCPYAGAPNISKITSTIKYNNPQKITIISSFTNKDSYGLEDGLAVWWPFNGNANDTAGIGNGTVIGATLTTGQNGQVNGAYNFTGSVNSITSSTIPVINTTLTLSAWIKPTNTPSDKYTILEGQTGAAYGYYLSMSSDNSLQIYWYGTLNPGYHSSGASTITLNVWNHVAATWDGTNARLYVNGVLRTTVAVSGAGTAVSNLLVGAESPSRQYLGTIDDARVYNRALSPTEITSLFALGAA